MYSRILNSKNDTTILGSSIRYRKGLLPALIFFLVFSMGTARSYENYNPSIDFGASRETPYSKSSPSSSVTDICNSLLKSNKTTLPNSVTVRNQRTAGKVAALGVILGARFALEPKNNINNSVSQSQNVASKRSNKAINKDRSALTIAAYRQCQKEFVLGKVASAK